MSNKNQSRDQQKIGKFYTFDVTEDKFNKAQMKMRSMYIKHFRNAFIFGFCVELMIVKTRIYENIIRSSTQKRLEAKKKEDDNITETQRLK